jgi:hypothetical protein
VCLCLCGSLEFAKPTHALGPADVDHATSNMPSIQINYEASCIISNTLYALLTIRQIFMGRYPNIL